MIFQFDGTLILNAQRNGLHLHSRKLIKGDGETAVKRYDDETMSNDLSPEAVQTQVERILGSEKFARSKRLRSLLRFTVTQTLEGHADTLKEYVIGTEVLKKPDTYDPRRDSLVRVLASRLRVKLKEYYNDGGSEDPLVIEFPKGKYVPRFQRREQLQTEVERKLRARNAYSLGKFLATKFNERSLNESSEHLEEAIEADPNWPAGRVSLASVYAFQGFFGFRRPREVWPQARAQAEAALNLDEMSSEAHIVVGMAHALYDWRWRDADSHFHRAIERDPYASNGHLWRAIAFLIPTGKMQEAQEELNHAHELTRAPFLDEGTALALYYAEHYEEVLKISEHPMNGPMPAWLPWIRSCALLGMNRAQEAIQLLERLHREEPGRVRITSTLGFAYGRAGQPDRAKEILSALQDRRAAGGWVGNYEIALVQTGLGDKNEAVALLQEAVREKESAVAFMSVDPRLKSLRDVPKFEGLTHRVVVDQVEPAGVEN
jgi:tetratricopeptide (TPR) repeat protein